MEILHDTMTISVDEHESQTPYSYLDVPLVETYWEATMTADATGKWNQIEGLLVAQGSESVYVSVALTRRGKDPDVALRLLFEAMHEAGMVIV